MVFVLVWSLPSGRYSSRGASYREILLCGVRNSLVRKLFSYKYPPFLHWYRSGPRRNFRLKPETRPIGTCPGFRLTSPTDLTARSTCRRHPPIPSHPAFRPPIPLLRLSLPRHVGGPSSSPFPRSNLRKSRREFRPSNGRPSQNPKPRHVAASKTAHDYRLSDASGPSRRHVSRRRPTERCHVDTLTSSRHGKTRSRHDEDTWRLTSARKSTVNGQR